MIDVPITGATGNVGGVVLSPLLDSGCRVRALVRNPAEATRPAGVDVARGDLTDADSLASALAAVDAVLLVWMAPIAAAPAAVRAIARHARRIVLLAPSDAGSPTHAASFV